MPAKTYLKKKNLIKSLPLQPNLNARPTVATVHSALIGRSRIHGVRIPAAIGQNWLSVTRDARRLKEETVRRFV